MKKKEVYRRLYSDYSKKYLDKIILSASFSILVAASTSAIAWLLDPAIKKLFIEKDQTLILLIPFLIIVSFTVKGFSLYFAKITMIGVGESVKKMLQYDMVNTLIGNDTQIIDKKHSGKFISNLTYDVSHITNLLSNAILTLFKDSLTLIGLFPSSISERIDGEIGSRYAAFKEVQVSSGRPSCCPIEDETKDSADADKESILTNP